MPFTLLINNTTMQVEAAADMPLLWVLRDILDLTGTKYGCGLGVCGACTVHLNGTAVRSCQVSVANCQGQAVTTIEGLSLRGDHPLQVAWQEASVPQCGYCQAGQIMQAADLLARRPDPTDEEIDQAMADVICRCGTYNRVRKAIRMTAHKGGKP